MSQSELDKKQWSLNIKNEAWIDFINNYWNKESKVISFNSYNIPLATKEEVFEAFLKASEAYKTEGQFNDLKIYIGGRQLTQEIKKFLPNSLDGNLFNYIERLTNISNNEEFMIYVNNLESFSAPLFTRIKLFLHKLYSEVGIQHGPVEVELFIGRYKQTPGGIHKDDCTNFHFVLEGEKTFYTWPSYLKDEKDMSVKQTFSGSEEYLDSTNIEWKKEYRRNLKTQAGQTIFCPYNWWHIATSPSLSISINIAAYPKGQAKIFIQELVQKIYNSASLTTGSSENFRDVVYQFIKEFNKEYSLKKIDTILEKAEKKFIEDAGLSTCDVFRGRH